MIFSTDPASIAVLISCAFAAWMIVELAFLFHQRRVAELRAVEEEQTLIAISRNMLAVINGNIESQQFAAFDNASSADRLRAARRLIQLVRGDDRERLFELSEGAGLFDETLRQLASASETRRIESVRDLESFGSPICIEALQRCLAEDRDPDVRLQAAVGLSKLGHLPECRELVSMLDFANQPLSKMHAGLFRSIAAHDCQTLSELARDTGFRVQRPILVEALGWATNFDVLEPLAHHARDPDPEVRCAALRAARRIGHPAASSWISVLLVDPCDSVRIQAVQACGELGLRETVPILLSLMQSPSWWLRTRTSEALEKLSSAPYGDAQQKAIVA